MTGWQRPTMCGGNGECIVISDTTDGRIAIGLVPANRAADQFMTASRAEFAAFIAAAKNGEYDHLTGDTRAVQGS